MPGMRALFKWAMPKMMGVTTGRATPAPTTGGYGTGNSGLEKRSQTSRDPFSKKDKDWIPLVETTASNDVDLSDGGSEWPLSEPKASHRVSIRRHSSRSIGRKWGISTAESLQETHETEPSRI